MGRVRISRKETDDEEEPVQRTADHWGSAGAGGGDLDGGCCRLHGVSAATFYKWKAKLDGMVVSNAKCLRALEDENVVSKTRLRHGLKKLLAELMLDIAILKDVNSRKW